MRSCSRVTFAPVVMGGKPCTCSLRVTVETAVGLLPAGRTPEETLHAYPSLERADIQQRLAYTCTLPARGA